jgi:hypothetical protein
MTRKSEKFITWKGTIEQSIPGVRVYGVSFGIVARKYRSNFISGNCPLNEIDISIRSHHVGALSTKIACYGNTPISRTMTMTRLNEARNSIFNPAHEKSNPKVRARETKCISTCNLSIRVIPKRSCKLITIRPSAKKYYRLNLFMSRNPTFSDFEVDKYLIEWNWFFRIFHS